MALIAQLVEHCTGNTKVVGSNPVQSLNFFQVSFPVVLWLYSHLSFFFLTVPYANLGCVKATLSTLRWRNLKTEISLWKCIKCFPSTLRPRSLKTQQVGQEDHMIIQTTSLSIKFVFKMFSVHMKTKKPAFSNCSVVKSVFKSSIFVTVRSDGRPNCRNKKLRFQIFPCNVDADVEWFRQFFRCIIHGPSDLGSDHKSCCRSSQKNAPLQYLQGWGKLSSHFYFP